MDQIVQYIMQVPYPEELSEQIVKKDVYQKTSLQKPILFGDLNGF